MRHAQRGTIGRAGTRRVTSMSGVLLAAALAGCGGGDDTARASDSSAAASAPAPVALAVPASFTGTLPCADCPGIATTVTLFGDSTYRLREVYQDRPGGPQMSMGRWLLDGGQVRLEGVGRALRFARAGEDTIRLLDGAGGPSTSAQPHELVRTDSVQWLRDDAVYVGTFTYMADAPNFRECGSGQEYPVRMQGAYRALERAYLAAKLPPGSGQQVEVRARFEPRPADMEGARDRDVLHVVQYIGPGANPDCR